jgi:hypothetical protein
MRRLIGLDYEHEKNGDLKKISSSLEKVMVFRVTVGSRKLEKRKTYTIS